MPTTQKGSWHEKLLVSERDSRRLVDLIAEKVKGFSQSPVVTNFSYKLAGGSSTKASSIDDLFFEDNLGSRAISAVYAEILIVEGTYKINLQFYSGDDDYKPTASFDITGADRDSVLVLASEIEERINLLRDRPIIPIRHNRSIPFFPFVLLIFLPLIIILLSTFAIVGVTVDKSKEETEKFLAKKPEKTIENLFELVVISHSSQQKITTKLPATAIPGIVAVLCVILLVFLLSVPGYKRKAHFMWGDYVRYYEEQKKKRDVWIYIVGVGFIVSVLSSVLTALFY